MRPRSQNERVLTLLRQRQQAERGLNTVELLRIPTADGGKPITRLAARIRDLQDQGHKIRSERRMDGTSSYFLVAEVERSVNHQPAPSPGLADRGTENPAVDVPLDVGLFDAAEFNRKPQPHYEAA